MEFSRQEYSSGFLFPTSGYLPDPGIELRSLAPSTLGGGFFTTNATWEAPSETISMSFDICATQTIIIPGVVASQDGLSN